MEKIFEMIPFINSAWKLAALSAVLLFLITVLTIDNRSKNSSEKSDQTKKVSTKYLLIIAIAAIIAAIIPHFLRQKSLPGSGEGVDTSTPNPTPVPVPKPFASYEDAVLSAVGLNASFDAEGKNATIALQITNKRTQELFIAHDRMDAISAITNTGETIKNQTCSPTNIRSITLKTLRNQVDQGMYNAIASRQSILVTVKCYLSVRNPKKVSQISITLPLVRIEGDEAKHFTISIPAIPIEK